MRCDIIIPVWNQLEYTRDCVDSVTENTSMDYTMVIVDNASDEPTRRYLEALKGSPGVKVIRNEENIGFVKAVNQAVAASDSAYLCLLNNDTIVAKGWLEEMIKVLDSTGNIGIVNPSSNTLGERPPDGMSIGVYAETLKSNSGRSVEIGACVGFCMLMKRSLINDIGMFDEIYGMGNFEDTDFSRRAVKKGYRCVRACGAYVFHREKASFGKVRSFDDDFRRNREIFEFRWGRPKRIAYIIRSGDDNMLKRINAESLKLARGGNWVWYISDADIKTPEHSNILSWRLSGRRFVMDAMLKILTKKKRFDELLVGDGALGNVLEKLSFLHKAKVGYY